MCHNVGMESIATVSLRAYNDSIRQDMPQIVDDLRRVLGAKLVAYIAAVTETRTIREWVETARRPSPAAEQRLRLAHRVVTLIRASDGAGIVPTWFQGMNPMLGDRSPARVLREDDFDDAGPRVLAAATAFVGA